MDAMEGITMKYVLSASLAMAPVACAGATGPSPHTATGTATTSAAATPAAETTPTTPTAATTPDPASAFDERELAIGDHQLPATLTLPQGRGPFAAVVLVHGSGPHDRDETLGPNKPFRDLAVGLASRGIATLRYDKRTLRFRAEFAATTYTVEQETLADARAAVATLAATPAIDARRIFVLGHSLGGTLAPRIAAHEPRVAGLIILAGATRPLDEIVVDQLKTAAPGNAEFAAQGAQFAKAFRDPALAPGDTVDALGSKLSGAYVLDLRAYDPAAAAAALRLPMLILQGGRDYQVTRADLDGWKRALAGHPNVAFKTYAAMNHLFIEGTEPPSPADYARAGHVAPVVLDDIAGWLSGREVAR
jgi:dienelactone hydrolase